MLCQIKYIIQISLTFVSLSVVFSTCLSSDVLDESESADVQEVMQKPTFIKTNLYKESQNDEFDEFKENSLKKNYKDFVAHCDQKKIVFTGSFRSKFKGRIYALDYVDDHECGIIVSNETLDNENITFSLPLDQCGVRMTVLNDNLENDLSHTVALYIQYSPFLQQIIDDKIIVSCVETKKSIENISSNSIGGVKARRSRQGRKFKDSSVKTGITKGTQIGEAWMEILSGKDPSPKSKSGQPVQVGEDVTVVVTTKVSRGYDARVVNCTAHDGSRTTSDGGRVQPILDSAGCSIDRGLVPNFRRRRLPIESRNQMTLHFATFPAFKFPERDHIHVRCSVAYCQGHCPQETCDSGTNHYGSWKDKYGRVADILVETSDIVNAVEVLSPEMESNGGHHYERHQSSNTGVGSASVASSSSSSSLSSSNSFTSDTSASSSSSSNSGSIGTGVGAGTSSRHQQQQQHHQFSDTQSSMPPQVPQQGNSGGYTNGVPSLNSNYHYSPHAINGQAIYSNNQIPQVGTMTSNPAVCISPGTVIIALVILGVVLVISATATLWLALKRSDTKKYNGQQKMMSSFNSSQAPSPYYRFNHW